MQANVTFNTHKAVKALKSSGFDEKQAEAVVETIDKAVNETVATKSDLALLGADLAVLTKTVEGIQENIDKNMATKADLEVMAAKIETLEKTVEGIQENIDKNMATKADLVVLEKTVKADIANLEARMMRMMWFQTTVLVGMLITVVVKLL